MNTAILYALLSLFFAGMNDVVFKRYATKDRSRGMMIFAIGLVWLILQSLALHGGDTDLRWDRISLAYGLAAGIALVLSNLLLIEGLTHIEVSLGSTIYRLNTIGVVLLSVLWLHETLDMPKAMGICSGILAILLLAGRPASGVTTQLHRQFVWLVIFASLLRALYGVITKAGLNQGGNVETMLFIAAICWVFGGAIYARLREGRFALAGKQIVYALISGLLVTLIVNFLTQAVSLGAASVVIPIANLSFVAALLFSVALGWERLTLRKLTAIGCAILSIGLLAY
jgi:uncharacterized membrane protein